MVLEIILGLMGSITQMNPVLLGVIFLFFIVIAYKVFQALIKAFIVGVIAASFPIVANLFGLDVPLTFYSVMWFALFGVAAFMLYATISGGAKIAGFAMKPFGVMFRKKNVKTIIIKEKETNRGKS